MLLDQNTQIMKMKRVISGGEGCDAPKKKKKSSTILQQLLSHCKLSYVLAQSPWATEQDRCSSNRRV